MIYLQSEVRGVNRQRKPRKEEEETARGVDSCIIEHNPASVGVDIVPDGFYLPLSLGCAFIL